MRAVMTNNGNTSDYAETLNSLNKQKIVWNIAAVAAVAVGALLFWQVAAIAIFPGVAAGIFCAYKGHQKKREKLDLESQIISSASARDTQSITRGMDIGLGQEASPSDSIPDKPDNYWQDNTRRNTPSPELAGAQK